MRITNEQAEQKLKHIAKSAERRGYSCTLTLQNVKLLMSAKTCAYTGIPFDDDRNSLSFDRIDNSRGYEPGNVIPVIGYVNHLKADYSLHALKTMVHTSRTRCDAHVQNVALQLEKKDKKIAARRKSIEELERLLERDLEEYQALLVEQKRAEKATSKAIRDSETYARIVNVLETKEDLGLSYMTYWQRAETFVRKRFPFLFTFTLFSKNQVTPAE